MDKSFLVKMFGFPASLIHGDTLVLDRWFWLKRHLPETVNGERLIDIGCGTGAFTIGAARRGYTALGLSWDERNQRVASERAGLCNAPQASFEVRDVRSLRARQDLVDKFNVAICFENIEHILDDRKLMRDIVGCLKPDGRLLLTAPNYHFRAMTQGDMGPFPTVEDGSHVRRGYSVGMLAELCAETGLIVEEVSYCSGFLSQKITQLLRLLSHIHPLFGWGITFPLRILPLIFDRILTPGLRWPYFSICLEAYKPRFTTTAPIEAAGAASINQKL
jgi:SAM-dependent methyltransferase